MKKSLLLPIFFLFSAGCSVNNAGIEDGYIFYKADLQRTGWFKTKGVKQLHKVKWTFNAGEILTSPVIYRGIMFVTGSRSGIYILEEKDGNLIAFLPFPSNLCFAPAIRNDSIFISVVSGLYLLDLKADTFKWVCPIGGVDNPIISEDMIFLPHFDTVCAVRMGIWQKVWRFQGTLSCGALFAMDGTLLFFATDEEYQRYSFLCCLDSKTGKLLWKRKIKSFPETPVVARGMVFEPVEKNFLCAFDERTGKTVWKFKASDEVSTSPAVVMNTVYFGCINGDFYALNALTGEKIWVFHGPTEITCDPVYADGVVYFACMGELFALDAKNGNVLWSYETGSLVFASPLVHDGVIYVGCINGILYALM